MKDGALETINDQVTLVEFALQDVLETHLVESAEDALARAEELCRILNDYVQKRKENGNGYRIQSSRLDRQPGERPAGQ